MPVRRARVRLAAPALAGIAAAALLLAAGPSAAAHETAVRAATVPAPPAVPTQVLAPVPTAPGATSPSSSPAAAADAALVARVTAALSAKPLGPDVTASVVDVATGRSLLGRGEARPQQPASTLKTLTATTVLRALGPDARVTTSVVGGAVAGQVVLVGGGDSTLTRLPAAPSSAPAGQSLRPASLTELAAATSAALRQAGRTSVTVAVDDTLFTGPRLAPGWPATYVTSGVVSPVSALSADGGRTSATARARDADPALAAGRFFATRLAASGITVTGSVVRSAAPASPTQIAAVRSPTIADLVERTLTQSDNDLAEALAHLAGRATGHGASFAGGATAVTETLGLLGIPTDGVRVVDGSGLSRLDLVPVSTVTKTLAVAAVDAPATGSRLAGLWPVGTGLPVAGVTGTLALRFTAAPTLAGRGVVRAKTGTLSGVVALAGTVRDSAGRLLVFSFVADRSPGPLLDAEAALDRAASALVG